MLLQHTVNLSTQHLVCMLLQRIVNLLMQHKPLLFCLLHGKTSLMGLRQAKPSTQGRTKQWVKCLPYVTLWTVQLYIMERNGPSCSSRTVNRQEIKVFIFPKSGLLKVRLTIDSIHAVKRWSHQDMWLKHISGWKCWLMYAENKFLGDKQTTNKRNTKADTHLDRSVGNSYDHWEHKPVLYTTQKWLYMSFSTQAKTTQDKETTHQNIK